MIAARMIRFAGPAIMWGLILPAMLESQMNPKFNIELSLDYAAAEQTVALFQGRPADTRQMASLRGNRIAASTAGLISDKNESAGALALYLDSLKDRQIIKNDIYNLEKARDRASSIEELLSELKVRNFSKRVAATVEQIFPDDAELTVSVPVHVVALGHENVDAYVRRISWRGDVPEFSPGGGGELTIVINLASAVRYGSDVEERFISILSVVAHELFHAAFGHYKENSASWKEYYGRRRPPVESLLDLAQNEGIAYYLSLEQSGGGRLPADWTVRTRNAFASFNKNSRILMSDTLSYRTSAAVLRNANLSGYWDSFGSITGMFMAREIDKRLGRAALIDCIRENPPNFFKKYLQLSINDTNLPGFSKRLNSYILKNSD